MDNNYERDLFAPILSSDALMGPILLLARLLTTGIFVFYISKEIAKIHPLSALLYMAITAQIIGIVMVVLGYKAKFASILLAVCLVATFFLFRGSLGFTNFLVTISEKILAITGCFLFMFAHGPGPLSLDRYLGTDKPTGITSNRAVMGPLLLVGRLFSIFVFVFFGISKILHTPEIKAYMVRHNPHVPTNLVYLAILVQIVPPLLVLLNYKTRYGAVALGGFCIVAPSLFHSAFGNPSEVEHFFLDFAIAGGVAFMFAEGPGPLSLDARPGRAKSTAQTQQALSVGT
jgi:putative oxidoreductase